MSCFSSSKTNTSSGCDSYYRLCKIGAFCLSLFVSAIASAGSFDFSSVEYVNADAGLSSDTVYSIAQDKTGLVWFGTASGIEVFDGLRVKKYRNLAPDLEDFPLLTPGNIFIDSRDRMWSGSWGQGAAQIAADRLNYTHFDPDDEALGLNSSKVQSFYQSRDGVVWLGTVTNGLVRFDESQRRFTALTHDAGDNNSLSNNRIWSITEDKDGFLWVGTSLGLNRVDRRDNSVQRFLNLANRSRPQQQIRAVSYSDGIWVGTGADFGLFEPSTGELTAFSPPGQSKLTVNRIVPDGAGGLWLATLDGLMHFDKKRRAFSKTLEGRYHYLHEEDVRDVFVGKNGIVWVGTRQSGVIKLNINNSPFSRFWDKHASSKRQNFVWDLKLDQNRRLWLGNRSGISIYNLDSKTYEKVPQTIADKIDDWVLSSARETNGDIWFGTNNNLYRYRSDDGSVEEFGHRIVETGINHVTTLMLDSAGSLWVGINDMGVFRLGRDRGVSHFPGATPNTQSSGNQISDIVEDSEGNIWVSTYGDGLSVKYKGSQYFEPFPYSARDRRSYLDSSIRDLMIVDDRYLWLASTNGIAIVDRTDKLADVIDQNNGLPSDETKAFARDYEGQVWVTTNAGVSKIDPETRTVSNFSISDDEHKNEFNPKALHLGFDKRLYIGGDNGVTVFDPAVKQAVIDYPIIVNELLINDERRNLGLFNRSIEVLDLPWDQRNFEISFASLDYNAQGRRQLIYKLVGFDEEWREANALKRATYTNLDPGAYEFRVIDPATLSQSATEAPQLRFTISPPYWQTFWFRGFVVIVVALAIYLFFRLRLRGLERAAETLELSVQMRTEELEKSNKELGAAYAQLREISYTDQLTKLKNRRFLYDFLVDEIANVYRHYDEHVDAGTPDAENRDLIFFLIDIDHFKSVNDEHGHDAGDRVLADIPSILKQVFRESDYLVRWGGEEFLVVARNTSRDGAAELAARLCSAFESHRFQVSDKISLRRTASIGFACFPFDERDVKKFSWEDVVKIADHGTYAAKFSGRNNWVGLRLSKTGDEGLSLDTIIQETGKMIEAGNLEVQTGRKIPLTWHS